MTRFFTLLFAAAVGLTTATPAFAQTDCTNPYDGNGDGAVTISDLLDLLGLFGDSDSDQDGIWDSVDACVDTSACNYASDPTEPCAYIDVLGICGGGCEGDGDGDGICDDVDTCAGDLDECGVCNGPGPTEIVIEDITILYDSVYLPQLDDWYVFEYGADTTFTYTCPPLFVDCGDPVSYQGYDYATVQIGDQCWFADNLRSENYRNGDTIPSPDLDLTWTYTSIGSTRVYGESCENCESFTTLGDACDPFSIAEFGRLYNWYAVIDPREVCPVGWHVSTDADWIQLEMHLGMSEEDASGTGYPRGANEGFLLKSSLGWHVGANGSDAVGFNGLPAGIIQISGNCGLAGMETIFWTPHLSSELNVFGDFPPYNAERVSRKLRSTDEYITRSAGGNHHYGLSIRCIKDYE
ncbi:MAG: fibrobacter succinogenes major paralogous domain-containing protein [Flavobacteriales bacterium]